MGLCVYFVRDMRSHVWEGGGVRRKPRAQFQQPMSRVHISVLKEEAMMSCQRGNV